MKKLAPLTILALAAALLWASAASAHIYWTNYSTSQIGRADTGGGNVNQSFVSSTGHPYGVATGGDHVYWTSRDNLIGRAGLDGSGPQPSFISGVNSPFDIAVDSQYAYWANNGSGSLGLANLDFPTSDGQGFYADSGTPVGVAVDGQYVYWSDPSTVSIGRAKLDGSDPEPNFITGVNVAYGLAVDSQHLYWANYNTGTIGRANLDGSGVDQSFIDGASMPEDVAVDGQHVYWANFGTNSIGRATLNGTGANQYFIGGASAPEGVAAEPVATGTATPSSRDVDLGGATVGRDGTAHSLTITNSGAGDLQVGDLALTGDDPADFSLSTDGCSEQTLSPGASCTVGLGLHPSATGAFTAALHVPSNDSIGPLDVALSGSGSEPTASDPPPPTGGRTAPLTPPSARHGWAVKCTIASKTATCAVSVPSLEPVSLRWALVRGRHVFARGLVRATSGAATIRVPRLSRLRPGRYALQVAGYRRATTIVIRRHR